MKYFVGFLKNRILGERDEMNFIKVVVLSFIEYFRHVFLALRSLKVKASFFRKSLLNLLGDSQCSEFILFIQFYKILLAFDIFMQK